MTAARATLPMPETQPLQDGPARSVSPWPEGREPEQGPPALATGLPVRRCHGT
jgi:hypothetical protein